MLSSGILKKTTGSVIGLMVFFCGIAILLQNVSAQQNQQRLMITWTAHNSYTPPSYIGKALPNRASQITASLALISATGQKINISNETIYWYLNDTLIGGGTGIQHISFTPLGGTPNFMALRVELPSHNGSLLIHEIKIPVVQPKTVIEAQHVNGEFNTNSLTIVGTPYYFNTTDPSTFIYQWSVNGQVPEITGNPKTLQINLDAETPSRSTLAITLSIANSDSSLNATDLVNLTYTK